MGWRKTCSRCPASSADYAKKFDVDVYSSNEVLQKELNSVAWASAAGNLTLSAASMVTGAAVLQAASGLRTLEQAKDLVNALPATELSQAEPGSVAANARA